MTDYKSAFLDILDRIATIKKNSGEFMRSRAYTKAHEKIILLKTLTSVDDIKNIKGVGPSVINKLKEFIINWDGKNNVIFVTHYVVISEILNYAPSSGEIIISDKELKVIDTIEIKY